MKKLLLLLFAVVSFTACKKTNEVDPQPKALADKFIGTYTLNSFRYIDTNEGVNLDLSPLPQTKDGKSISGTVSLVKKTDTTVDMKFLLKTTGVDDVNFDIEGLEVRQVGSEYGLFLDGTRIADVEGTIVIFNYSETDPQTQAKVEIAFNAKR